MRNCDGLVSTNGFAFATHGLGSHSGSPPAPASGFHSPGAPEPNVQPIGVAAVVPFRKHRVGRHRSDRFALFLGNASGIAASDRSYAVCSDA